MHSTKINDTVFHHSDYSGEVIISRGDELIDLRVPFEDLKEFIAEYIRGQLKETSNKILDEMDTDQLLGVDIDG
jgi:hypothetical protein